MSTTKEKQFTPARLSFFAIYSPPLGPTDETFRDQVVFYYSRAARQGRRANKGSKNDDNGNNDNDDKDYENEKLRQIGLAQGMVGFARNFSDGEPVDSVETEKSRVLMHELEKDWWVLASIHLTRLPPSNPGQQSEYSSREVSPAPLLLQQILSAQRIFALHHGPSISDMYVKLPRDKFSGILDRFWSRFCKSWDVLLHGNPAVDVFGGLKLAAGGELGFGVGEEEWGSGERDVLEQLVQNTEGLVDLSVSRFGEAAPPERDYAEDSPSQDTLDDARSGLPWLGCGHEPQAPDGLVFGGVGAIARHSLRDISCWTHDIYINGEHAYGVKDNPHRPRRRRRRRQPVESPSVDDDDDDDGDGDDPTAGQAATIHETDVGNKATQPPNTEETNPRNKAIQPPNTEETNIPLPHDPRPSRPGIPPPIVSAADASLERALAAASKSAPTQAKEDSSWNLGSSDKWVKYLTFGLASGKASDTPSTRPEAPHRSSTSSSNKPSDSKEKANDQPPMQHLDPLPEGHQVAALISRQRYLENHGHFLVGYQGSLDQPATESDDDANSEDMSDSERNLLRTLQIELIPSSQPQTVDADSDITPDALDNSDKDTSATKGYQRLRVLVYIHRPFVYVFLFDQHTLSLQISSFYRNLHLHVRPLHRSLLASTSTHNVASRIAAVHASPASPQSINPSQPPYAPPRTSPVFDFVYDPVNLSVHTSLPNIPAPGQMSPQNGMVSTTSTGRDAPPPWTRLEALNVHSHILNTLAVAEKSPNDTERTSKTSRHWWVVWLRFPKPGAKDGEVPKPEHCRTAFLVRKARDHVTSTGGRMTNSMGMGRLSSGMFSGYLGRGVEEEDAKEGWGSAAALAGGIGVDARKYVENLLSLNR